MYAAAFFLHITATCLWLGHMFFWSLISGPALKKIDPPETALREWPVDTANLIGKADDLTHMIRCRSNKRLGAGKPADRFTPALRFCRLLNQNIIELEAQTIGHLLKTRTGAVAGRADRDDRFNRWVGITTQNVSGLPATGHDDRRMVHAPSCPEPKNCGGLS